MQLKHFLLWLPMIGIAFGNAALREWFFVKHFPDLRAQQLSTLTLIVLCAIYVSLLYPLLAIQSGRQALWIGFIWMILTVLFEFTLGRMVNRPWMLLLQDYNLLQGRIWPLFLCSLLLLPYLLYTIRK
jgi:hypothetical protein